MKTKMKSDKNNPVMSINYLRSFTRQEIFKYIRKLHKMVRRQQKKLRRYKYKIKFLKNIKEPEGKDVNKEAVKNGDKAKTFIEEITEAAEVAQSKTDFVYEPTSGLYYDQRTGYYYNAEFGLYYDGSSGCYYSYNQEKNEFVFHSRVQPQSANVDQVSVSSYLNNLIKQFSNLKINQLRANALGKFLSFCLSENTYFFVLQVSANRACRNNTEKSVINNGNSKRKRKKRAKYNDRSPSREDKLKLNQKDVEDGEITSSSESDSPEATVISDSNSCDVQCSYEDVAKKYPPSLRIVVQETNLPKLKIGTLFMITFKGGSLGREGSHDVIIPDVNVSKYHLKFTYDENESMYKCTDLGSRNGTFLNGKRMSNAKQESDPLNLVHGSVLLLSQTKLLCHVHSGNSTCGHCEPGLIIEQQNTDKVVTLSHKAQLKVLQKRYGLENEKYVVTGNKADPNYSDRAAVRRDKFGSTNEFEKTEVASLETAIPSHNKGFKLLSKLGWSQGESLGKVQGILEPIDLVSNEGKTGLGCEQRPVSIPLTKKNQRKLESMAKTQQRYNQLKPSNIFVDSDETSTE